MRRDWSERIDRHRGGTSTEREISKVNAAHIQESLARRGYETVMLDYDRELARNLTSHGVSFVYLCAQGKWHGDGTLQGVLDYLGIP